MQLKMILEPLTLLPPPVMLGLQVWVTMVKVMLGTNHSALWMLSTELQPQPQIIAFHPTYSSLNLNIKNSFPWIFGSFLRASRIT